ncbi:MULTISPECIES: OmpA family protein [unclassified Streptomyces]|uniref:OmpA family protein n=1 Tax=unclassified Streptomyces TaxID=2593676 RepID=UPI0001C1C51A|nr:MULTISPECIES: OmpA family protein [unclassified Streptomyces]AEN12100.1 OmpA/MotB domain protein [Streptomyces sp. SirexAA-E]MYR68191.1 OmpA family protein [Streptomyces sp. SID4939]MYS03247.1 OmpA family protein [Streptomyces sp. SID4940]MYT66859.1 OmpA family protein [Streptomyces sp. SID8357]MYT88364.1 OmpA family protein [Streptomyces sp. SID8360]
MGAAASARRAKTRVALTVVVSALAIGGGDIPQAVADDSPYPSASAEPPVEVDANDSDLKLPEGATLAPPKVLDIKSVVEDLGGEERREDTNADIKFALQAEVLFGKDSAKLSSDANSRINAIAAEIKNQDAKKVRVFGFTDNLGSSEHGDVLSKERAEAVHNVLDASLAGTGITFEIRGYGEQYPIADNSSEEGRKKNRRVEVSFQRTEGSQG